NVSAADRAVRHEQRPSDCAPVEVAARPAEAGASLPEAPAETGAGDGAVATVARGGGEGAGRGAGGAARGGAAEGGTAAEDGAPGEGGRGGRGAARGAPEVTGERSGACAEVRQDGAGGAGRF